MLDIEEILEELSVVERKQKIEFERNLKILSNYF